MKDKLTIQKISVYIYSALFAFLGSEAFFWKMPYQEPKLLALVR